MDNLNLQKPDKTHEKAYYRLIRDWKDSQCTLPRMLVPAYENFNEVLLIYNRLARGDNPSTTYLLMDGERIAGVVALRHKLDAFLQEFGGNLSFSLAPDYRGKGLENNIIRLAMESARKDLGLSVLVISCGKGNNPMREAAEANGGKKTADNENSGIDYITYRIKLTA